MQKKEKKSRLIEGNELIGYYRSVGRMSEAAALADEMLELAAQSMNDSAQDRLEYATTLLNAATAYRAADNPEKALRMYKEALELYEEAGIKDARKAGLYNNMSMAYQALGRYEEAVVCLEHALMMIQKIPNTESETATTYVNLTSVCFEMGNYDMGIQNVRKALEIFERADGENDAHYAGALALLAQGYYHQEDYEQSIAYYTAALREILKHFGKNPSYAMTCENCAVVLEKAGFPKEAEHLRAEARQANEQMQKGISGLELSRKYYETYGKPMLRERFPEYEKRAAVGLAGHGSECLGFDDAWSKDHDFGPAFCIWLTEEDYQKVGTKMQEAYDSLPKEFWDFPQELFPHMAKDESEYGIFVRFMKNLPETEAGSRWKMRNLPWR